MVAAALVVVVVGQRSRVELARYANNSYFMDSSSRKVLDRVPEDARAVHIEGFGQTTNSQAEQPLTYHLVNETLPGRASISLASAANNGTQYLNFGVAVPPGPEFKPDYTHVLTRFAGIRTDRRRIARPAPSRSTSAPARSTSRPMRGSTRRSHGSTAAARHG